MPYQESRATRTYFDTAFDIPAVKVLPTEYYVSSDEIMISTVLGSCVSACIRDNQTGLAGMNHFMLPAGDPASPASATMRYGAYAMESLINELLKHGASRARLEAKVFGGGAVLDAMRETNIGERNAAFVVNYLRLENIPIVARDLGGPHARRINYFVRTGQVLVRKLISQHRAESVIAKRELQVARSVQQAADGKA